MIFSLAYHNQFYAERKSTHDSPICLCKRFKDGEEMLDRSKLPTMIPGTFTPLAKAFEERTTSPPEKVQQKEAELERLF